VSALAPELASFAIGLESREIPSEVRARATLHFLDAIGCGLAAVGMGAGAHATHVAAEQGGRQETSLLGSVKRVPPAPAALANGTRCHSLDFDDTHERGICHSSAVVAPAALAMGQAQGSSGRAVLDAYILGSEVAVRIAVTTADGLYVRGFHPTSVCGVFGSATAASRLLGLDVVATTNALGISGSFASGLFEYLSDGSATKPLHAGWAGQAGIYAAQLAAQGATGPASVLEGRFGLLTSHAGNQGDASEITGRLGERWEITELSIKPFPACHFAHASTWAAGQLVDHNEIPVDDVADIVVQVPAEGVPLVLDPIDAKLAPRTPYDAKFSLPYTVAHRLIHGHLDLGSFSSDRIGEPRVLALAQRVRGGVLDNPPSRFAGRALIRTVSGDEFDRLVEHAPGSPGNPLDERWVLSKCQANAGLALPAAKASELVQRLQGLDALDSVAEVGDFLGEAVQEDCGL
jgi:2-methylcitrate dehydratase PrpD